MLALRASASEFAKYYFDHPQLLKEIALTEVMREALRAAAPAQAAKAVETWPAITCSSCVTLAARTSPASSKSRHTLQPRLP
jgi:hypothetical protein